MPRRRHDARGSRCARKHDPRGGWSPTALCFAENRAKLFLHCSNFSSAASFAWLRMKCSLGAMAPTGAAYPAAPRARSNLVRLANAAEKRAHAVGPTQRYVTRASPLPSHAFLSIRAFRRVSTEISRATQKRGRLDARHANHANLRPTYSPFVAWTRFVAARALENGPRSPRAPRMTARDAARFFESQTVNCFTCETTDDSYVRK